VTRRLEWDDPSAPPPPKHPYRDSALLYGAMAVVILVVAWLTGGSIARAIVFAGAAFVGATAWSWWRVRERLARAVPEGFRLVDLYDVWLGAPALPGQVVASVYRATFPPEAVQPPALGAATEALLLARTLPRDRQKGQATVRYDLRPFVESLSVGDADGTLRVTLRHGAERRIGRPGEVLAALRDEVGSDLVPESLVREGLVLAALPAPAAGAPRHARQAPVPATRPRR